MEEDLEGGEIMLEWEGGERKGRNEADGKKLGREEEMDEEV